MLTVHCLDYSRALRVLWLLEELGADYDVVQYERTEDFGAPDRLQKIHPLGKSPTIVDGELTLAESATILRYIRRKHGPGDLAPPEDTIDYEIHEQWVDYAEGSLAMPLSSVLVARMEHQTPPERSVGALREHLDYIGQALNGRDYLMGPKLTLADIQMSYLLALADIAGVLSDRPALQAYWQRLKIAPGLKRATERAGPMKPPIDVSQET